MIFKICYVLRAVFRHSEDIKGKLIVSIAGWQAKIFSSISYPPFYPDTNDPVLKICDL